MRAAGARERYVSARAADLVLAAGQRDFRRRLRGLAKELAPTMAFRSRTEIRWIYRAAVNALCDEVDQIWRAKIAAMPTVASRRLSLVDPREERKG